MIAYFDSSALAKRYIGEVGTHVVLDIFAHAQLILSSRLGWLEVVSAVSRLFRENKLRCADEVIRAVDEDFATVIGIIEVSSQVIAEARGLTMQHGLRAGDAIQLASTLSARAWHGADIVFVCADERLNTIARLCSVPVINPQETTS